MFWILRASLKRILNKRNCIRPTDDMVIPSNGTKNYKAGIIIKLEEGTKIYTMKINIVKTTDREIKVSGQFVNSKSRKTEIGIPMVKEPFNKKKTYFADFEMRKRPLKRYLGSTLFYICELWTLGTKEGRIEMWMLGRMKRTKWVERVSNEEVLKTIKENRTLLNTIIKRERN